MEEFDHLLCITADKWRNYYRILQREKAERPIDEARKSRPNLCQALPKSFFILVYLKNYALQEMTASEFWFFRAGKQMAKSRSLCS
ncbi:MAG: hypothetical protein R2788_26355 [Saprospiraceae bacterium]